MTARSHDGAGTDEPETRRLLAAQGTEADVRAKDSFVAFMEADRTRWRDLIARAGIQPI